MNSELHWSNTNPELRCALWVKVTEVMGLNWIHFISWKLLAKTMLSLLQIRIHSSSSWSAIFINYNREEMSQRMILYKFSVLKCFYDRNNIDFFQWLKLCITRNYVLSYRYQLKDHRLSKTSNNMDGNRDLDSSLILLRCQGYVFVLGSCSFWKKYQGNQNQTWTIAVHLSMDIPIAIL